MSIHPALLEDLCGAGVGLGFFSFIKRSLFADLCQTGSVVGMTKQTSDGQEVDMGLLNC